MTEAKSMKMHFQDDSSSYRKGIALTLYDIDDMRQIGKSGYLPLLFYKVRRRNALKCLPHERAITFLIKDFSLIMLLTSLKKSFVPLKFHSFELISVVYFL